MFNNDAENIALIYESLKPAKSLEAIAKKQKVDLDVVKKALKEGAKIEKEHTTDHATAERIASHHLFEKINYYKLLKKYVE